MENKEPSRLGIIEICKHEIEFGGLCTICGASTQFNEKNKDHKSYVALNKDLKLNKK